MNKVTDEVRDFLTGELRFAVVAAINNDGTPQQTVVWYELRGDSIMMNTTANRLKTKNLNRDPRMSFCVEDGYRFVTVKGRGELVYDRDRAQADIRDLAIRYHGQEKGEQMASEKFSKEERVSIYMTVQEVYAYS